jgi:hypothetical protein
LELHDRMSGGKLVAMSDDSAALAFGRRILEDMRSTSPRLDGTDDSVWCVQGSLALMASDPRTRDGAASGDQLAYAVYVAELLASGCEGVRAEIEADGDSVAEVSAVRDDGITQFVLSWVQNRVQDPNAGNIVFKYACALREFGQPARASQLDDQLREFNASGHSF